MLRARVVPTTLLLNGAIVSAPQKSPKLEPRLFQLLRDLPEWPDDADELEEQLKARRRSHWVQRLNLACLHESRASQGLLAEYEALP
jgi:hypothetical protein